MLKRSFFSGGIALFPTFLGQSVSLKTASSNFSSGNDGRNASDMCSHRRDIPNVIFPLTAALSCSCIEVDPHVRNSEFVLSFNYKKMFFKRIVRTGDMFLYVCQVIL